MRPFIAGVVVTLSLAIPGCGSAGSTNECGGQKALSGRPGEGCEQGGLWTCDGSDAVVCRSCPGGACAVAGTAFIMGCDDCTRAGDRRQKARAEAPRHTTTVASFKIDRLEVSVREYRACGACAAPATWDRRCNWNVEGRDDHPVNCVTWVQARAYCEAVGKRLCSEAEWELAARGTDGRAFPWGGDTPSCDHAVYDDGFGEETEFDFSTARDGCGTGTTAPVGSRQRGASPFGVLDMAGNVAEWVEDDWHRDYQGAPEDGRAWCDGAQGCVHPSTARAYSRTVKGGGFSSYGRAQRTSARAWGYPTQLMLDAYNIGFRCCQ